MLREATSASFELTRGFLRRRYLFRAGRATCERPLSERDYAELEACQLQQPVAVAEEGRRRYWWFHDRFWWEDDDLGAADVMALVLERERRAQRRLERAHALMGAEERGPPAGRSAITVEVKRAVWERCAGRCVECGTDSVLEFDHIIPLAMGGSNGERNLQLLCAECNRAKADAL